MNTARRGGSSLAALMLALAVIGLLLLAAACSGAGTEQPTYLTPIPEATLAAFQFGAPIESRLQAVIAARVTLGTTRLSFAVEPLVVSAEELSLAEARERAAQPGATTYEDRPPDTRVWLVFFEGDYQVIPPDPMHTITPDPPVHGCAYVLLEPSDAGRAEVGTIACPA